MTVVAAIICDDTVTGEIIALLGLSHPDFKDVEMLEVFIGRSIEIYPADRRGTFLSLTSFSGFYRC